MRRRVLMTALIVSPLLALATGCADDDDGETTSPAETTSAPVKPTASASVSLAQREWDLSSKEQREEYCREYTQRQLTSPNDLGYSEKDVTDEFLAEFKELLKTKC